MAPRRLGSRLQQVISEPLLGRRSLVILDGQEHRDRKRLKVMNRYAERRAGVDPRCPQTEALILEALP